MKRLVSNKSSRKRVKTMAKKSFVLRPGMDFSEVEDNPNFSKILRALVNEAGKEAYLEAEAAGVPRTILKGNKIISIRSDNTEVVLKSSNRIQGPYFREFKKGLVFHASKRQEN